ncbi:MAG: ABC transporter permease [Balneolaceae bacterium]
MLKNYLKIAFRNLGKNPGYSFINVFGLALGIMAFILILLYINHELSYDTYHENSDDIYRVSREWKNQDGETSLHLGHVAPPFAVLIKEDYSAYVEESVRLFNVSPLISYENNHFVEDRFFFADAEVFNVFSWEMIHGNPETALVAPDGIVITETTAMKYFGETDVVGKQLTFSLSGAELPFQVNGVVKDVPDNSHFQFDFLASMVPLIQFYGGYDNFMGNFGNNSFSTFLLLNENADPVELEAKFPELIDKVFPAQNNNNGLNSSEFMSLHLMPLTDIHLRSNLDSEIEANGNIEYVYIYSAVALFILFIACINFMNLSTARSSKRANEVGLRKVMGAQRTSLIRQFMGESFLLAFLGLIVAIVLVEVLLPYYNNFVGKDLIFNFITDLKWISILLGVVLVIGVVAGSYPAMVLSAFQPATVLKGSFKAKNSHQFFRSALVVTQFTISIGLIVSMGIVYQQLDFIQSKDLGFNKENVAVLSVDPEIESNYVDIKNRLMQQPGVLNVSMQSRVPSGRLLDSQQASVEVNGELESITFRIADIHVSHNFLDLFGIEMVSGRNFDIELASDSSEAFILNEIAIKRLGFVEPEDAIGKQFTYGGRTGFITGVVKDFHFESLHQSIAPIVFMISQGRNNSIAVRFREAYRDETIAFIEDQWTSYIPNLPFTYQLLEDSFNDQYQSERKLGETFSYFAILAVIIAALGLFGLASFTAQQRIKEIGIRKVLGASVAQLVTLLSTNFAKLIFIAFLIATPIVWFGMNKWLDSFAYHESIPIWIFFAGGIIAIVVAMLTISYQAIKAAVANPVNSLKSE